MTFDDEHKAGHCKIHLKIPGLKVAGFFGGGKPENVDVKEDISTELGNFFML